MADAGLIQLDRIIAEVDAGRPVAVDIKFASLCVSFDAHANDAHANVSGFATQARILLANGTARAVFPLSVTGEGGSITESRDTDKRWIRLMLPRLAPANVTAVTAALRAIEPSCVLMNITPVHHPMSEPMRCVSPPPSFPRCHLFEGSTEKLQQLAVTPPAEEASTAAAAEEPTSFQWDGTEEIEAIMSYTTSLGPRDTSTTTGAPAAAVLPLSTAEASSIITLYRRLCSSCVYPEVSDQEYEQARIVGDNLASRIDTFLSELPTSNSSGYFIKTNRHSCKDSPIDHPTAADIETFRAELRDRGLWHPKPKGTDPDSIDFGPAFEAFCSARLKATAVHSGEDAVSLLERSHRTHDDLELQLDNCKSEDSWDLYLAFIPFEANVAHTPLNEFRCFVSRGVVRCVAQYSYMVACPIPPEDMPSAGRACAVFASQLIPTLPEGVCDVALDVRCIPTAATQNGNNNFDVSLIEVNPLGPGCVWGVVDWKRDKDWLLGKSNTTALTLPCSRPDTTGNVTDYVWDSDGKVMVAFTSAHAAGCEMGGLAHMPPEFLIEVHEAWELKQLFEDCHAAEAQVRARDAAAKNTCRGCMVQ